MPYKDKEKHKAYYRNYYHTHDLKEIQSARARLNYWRKKFVKKFNCSLQDCEKFSEQELREQIKTELCRV